MAGIIPDMDSVLEYLRQNGFVEAESALRDDIVERASDSGLTPTSLRPVGSPRLPTPPPPVRIVLGAPSQHHLPVAPDSGSSSDSSSDFVSMGSSPSELVNPFGLWSASDGIKSGDDASDRLSEFGTAREYNDFDIMNDMYWYGERDVGFRRQPFGEVTDVSSCPSEDKFVTSVEAEEQFGRHTGAALNLVSGGFHSVTSINHSEDPDPLSTTEDASADYLKDQMDTALLNTVATPFCDCCSGQKGYYGTVSDDVVYDSDKEQLREPDISLYGCCYELMSDEPKSFQATGRLHELPPKPVDEYPSAASWEQNVTGPLHRDRSSFGNKNQASTSESPGKELEVLDSMVMEMSSTISGGGSPKNHNNNDFKYSNKRSFGPLGDDKEFRKNEETHCHIAENASPLFGNDDDYEAGDAGTPIRESEDNGTTTDGGEHATSTELQMYDNHEDEYEIFELRIIHRKNRTGFEENKDFPIVINTIVAGRYYVTEFLGSAAFSKVIQAHDLQTGIDVCLKIIKNDKDFFDQSLDEIKLLKYVNKYDPADERHLLRLYDYFYHQEHLFIVCELLRANLYEFQKFNHDSGGEVYFTLPRLQKITRQCLEALQYLHHLGIIHCDLKPENILIKSYSRCEIKVIDLGSSCFQTDNLCLYVQSRSYRAPEVILGLPYDQKIDIWSLGCILAELCSGDVLFPNDSLVMLLVRMVGMLGPIDMEMLEKGQETHKYFTSDYDLYYRNEETDEVEYIIPEKCSLKRRLDVSDANFIGFIRELLQTNPKKRPTATEALQHPWLSQPY